MSKETGGLAFPTSRNVCSNDPGMTLRDYFAAKAMQALVTRASGEDEKWCFNQAASFAYQLADAMLAERAK